MWGFGVHDLGHWGGEEMWGLGVSVLRCGVFGWRRDLGFFRNLKGPIFWMPLYWGTCCIWVVEVRSYFLETTLVLGFKVYGGHLQNWNLGSRV